MNNLLFTTLLSIIYLEGGLLIIPFNDLNFLDYLLTNADTFDKKE
jgi:hypothetical protein